MSAGRIPLDVTARDPAGAVTPGSRLYVFGRATTQQVQLYSSETGSGLVSQPLVANSEGKYPNVWVPTGSLDLYSPDDAVNPTIPWASPEVIITPEQFGAKGDGVTDDTAAFRAMIAYAVTLPAVRPIEFKLGPKTYLINGAPRTDQNGNSVLSLSAALSHRQMIFTGTGQGDGTTVLKSNRTSDAYDASFGPPAFFGSGTFEGVGIIFPWTGQMRFKDFIIQLPENGSLAGIDAWGFGGVDVDNVGVYYGTTATPANNTHPYTFGLRTPTSYDGGHVQLRRLMVRGACAGIVFNKTDHCVMNGVHVTNCQMGLGFEEYDDGGFGVVAHPGGPSYIMAEYNKYTMAGWSPTSGAISLPGGSGIHPVSGWWIDIEEPPPGYAQNPMAKIVLDANNRLHGDVKFFNLNSGQGTGGGGGFTGGQGLRVEHGGYYGAAIRQLACAATLTIPPDSDVWAMTGAVQITSITASRPMREVTLLFTAFTNTGITDGNNINLNNNTNLGTTGTRIIKLLSDGTNWIELFRSGY
jgi:hypothetical protein